MGKDSAFSNGSAIIEMLYLESLTVKMEQLEIEKQKYLLNNKNKSQENDDWLIAQDIEIEEIKIKIQKTIQYIKSLPRGKEDQARSWWQFWRKD